MSLNSLIRIFLISSVGAVIVDLFKFQSVEVRKDLLIKNICQISKQSSSGVSAPLTTYCNASKASLQNYSMQFLSGILKDSSLHLQKQSTGYEIERMNIGLFSLYLSFISAMIPLGTCACGALDLWYGLVVLLHSLLITSTSYIEEEHQFWYFAITTSFFIIFLSDQRTLLNIMPRGQKLSMTELALCCKHAAPYFSVMVLFRIIRAWNQTGIKWLSQKDISSSLLLRDNRTPLILLIFISLALILYLFFWKASKFYRTVSAVAILLVFIHKIIALKGSIVWPFSINGVAEARVVFAVCLIMLLKSATSNRVDVWKRLRPITALSSLLSNSSYIGDNAKLQNTERLTDFQESNDCVTRKSVEKVEYSGGGPFHAFLLLYIILQRPHNIVWLCLVLIMERVITRITCQR